MKVIVCGGRHYGNKKLVYKVLDAVNPNFVVTGRCPSGADRIAEEWADEKGILFQGIEANWRKYGIAAGPLRNSQIVEKGADLCIAFHGGKGTDNMMRKAQEAEIPVLFVFEGWKPVEEKA